MPATHALKDVCVYAPPSGWGVRARPPEQPLVALALGEDGSIPATDDEALALFCVIPFPQGDAEAALAQYLGPRVVQGVPVHIAVRLPALPEARAATWTDGVTSIVSCTTALYGGLLLEAAVCPWDWKGGSETELLLMHAARLRWAKASASG